jgi:hypothetical protein
MSEQPNIDIETAANLSEEIYEEFFKASSKFPAFASEHEGYAILLEEVDELWEVVKLNQKKPERHNLCRKECIQVAAMALRFLYDRTPEWQQAGEP